jgi:hypothetical protein
MMAQSSESPNRDNFGTVSGLHFRSPGDKEPLGRARDGAMQKILYGGRWWLPPRARAVVSPRSPVACPNTKKVQNEF